MAKKTNKIDYYGAPPKTIRGEPFYGLELDEEQLNFAEAIWNPENLIVFANACAGSGKTTIAVGVANMLVTTGMAVIGIATTAIITSIIVRNNRK